MAPTGIDSFLVLCHYLTFLQVSRAKAGAQPRRRVMSGMTTWQKRGLAEENPDTTACIVFVTPEEAAILLLADGERQGIGVDKVNRYAMQTLRELELIENIGARAGRTAVHRFTPKADTWLQFRTREYDEQWFDIAQDAPPRNGEWRQELEQIAGPRAKLALQNYGMQQAELQARRRK